MAILTACSAAWTCSRKRRRSLSRAWPGAVYGVRRSGNWRRCGVRTLQRLTGTGCPGWLCWPRTPMSGWTSFPRNTGVRSRRLDQIPDEELDTLARWGFTGLWLIGLWERSRASQRIKQLMGNPEAVASAYSLLRLPNRGRPGRRRGLPNLTERAWQRGIRLASDMVPNHMGIDSPLGDRTPGLVHLAGLQPLPLLHLQRAGPVLRRACGHLPGRPLLRRIRCRRGFQAAWIAGRASETYIYHGNDGTSMPWNDTAQLNYLNPEVREAVIQTILHVARKFPIIRFDAAMTLAKQTLSSACGSRSRAPAGPSPRARSTA